MSKKEEIEQLMYNKPVMGDRKPVIVGPTIRHTEDSITINALPPIEYLEIGLNWLEYAEQHGWAFKDGRGILVDRKSTIKAWIVRLQRLIADGVPETWR
jgi:hypothetical protein